ncbi:MAG: hypothetical protein ACRDSK_27225 [Actinophytocola sp.]|uniref:hypothetical protein n=1 Tax=Actinophytocola sp. TaxID=1872138 RepID=UPI003D6B28D5
MFATTGQPSARVPLDPAAAPVEPAPAGWRWEVYGGIEVMVPDDWGHGTTGSPPCLAGERDEPRRGYVGRPGAIPSIACAGPPVPALDKRSPYLWFDSRAGAGKSAHDAGWVEQTREVGGLSLTVLSDDPAVRARILDSARAGRGGCPAEPGVRPRPGTRPDPGPGGLAALGPVQSATVCRYTFASEGPANGSLLLSAGPLSEQDARDVVRAILAAPRGSGPNEPRNCMREYAYGDEVLLLLVRDRARTQEVVVRYDACDGHGFDDGHSHRRITADSLAPLLAGPHRPSVMSGAVYDLVWR